MTPRVTVLVFSYQHERYIVEAIESVLAQRGITLEIVVSDDGSTDASPALIAELARRHPQTIVPILRTENEGTKGHAWHAEMFKRVRGEYVALLDGDDYWTDSTKLARQVAFLDAHPDATMCCHDVVLHFEDDPRADRQLFDRSTPRRFDLAELVVDNPVATCSMLLRLTAISALPPWLLEAETQDWALVVALGRAGEVWALPEVAAVYRIHCHGMASGRSLLDAMLAIAAQYELLKCAVPEHATLLRARLVDAWCDCAFEHLRLDHRREARRCLGRSYATLGPRVSELLLWSHRRARRTRLLLWILFPWPVKRDLRPRTVSDEWR